MQDEFEHAPIGLEKRRLIELNIKGEEKHYIHFNNFEELPSLLANTAVGTINEATIYLSARHLTEPHWEHLQPSYIEHKNYLGKLREIVPSLFKKNPEGNARPTSPAPIPTPTPTPVPTPAPAPTTPIAPAQPTIEGLIHAKYGDGVIIFDNDMIYVEETREFKPLSPTSGPTLICAPDEFVQMDRLQVGTFKGVRGREPRKLSLDEIAARAEEIGAQFVARKGKEKSIQSFYYLYRCTNERMNELLSPFSVAAYRARVAQKPN